MDTGYEFGWNDPPTYSYSSLQNASGKKTHLTKRPQQFSSSPSSSSTATDKPAPIQAPLNFSGGPPTDGPPIETKSCKQNASTTTKETTDDNEDAAKNVDFTDTVQRLRDVTNSLQERLQKRVYEDIMRRLELLSKQAENGKLSVPVQSKTSQIVKAIDSGDYDEADRLHVGLMVDHISEVSQWLVGIKRLITVLKEGK